MIPSPYASRYDNWARGCPGGSADFGPVLTDNLTPGSPAFIMGQRVAALNQQSKQNGAEATAEQRAARFAKAGRGGQAKRVGAPGEPLRIYGSGGAPPVAAPPGAHRADTPPPDRSTLLLMTANAQKDKSVLSQGHHKS